MAEDTIVSNEVEAAFRTVPRHLFAPGATLEESYVQDTVRTKRDEHGITISAISAPQIQAMMLEQAGLRPDMRVMEIGSGGYNTALLAELVGEVTTVDIDPEATDRARSCLTEAGYPRVNAVLADTEGGVPQHVPYDQIIVTVGVWDIPPAWVDHSFAQGGTLTVPLRMRSLTPSITFERNGDHLVSQSAQVCGFVPMRGAGAHTERLLLRGKEIGLRFDGGLPDNPALLTGALDTTRVEVWTGVVIERMVPFDTLQLWLATALDGYCRNPPLIFNGVGRPSRHRPRCALYQPRPVPVSSASSWSAGP